GRPDDLERAGGNPRHERPGVGPAPGAAGRRAVPRRTVRRSRHAPGDGRGKRVRRLLGIFLMVLVLYAVVMASGPNARSRVNPQNIAERTGFYGVLTLGAGLLIISGGIDLSIGSVVGLSAVCFALLIERGVSPWTAAAAVLAGAPWIGLFHGLLVTKLRLQ